MNEIDQKQASELGRALGKLGRGKPKNFSDEERKRRSDRMKAYHERIAFEKKLKKVRAQQVGLQVVG